MSRRDPTFASIGLRKSPLEAGESPQGPISPRGRRISRPRLLVPPSTRLHHRPLPLLPRSPSISSAVIFAPRVTKEWGFEVAERARSGRPGIGQVLSWVAVALRPAAAMAFVRSYSSASSGMGVAAECKETFLELQRKKAHRYIIFKIDEKGKEVVVEKTGAVTESFDDFMGSLPETDCRYAVYDFDFVTEENCQKSKIFFIAWSPSVSRIRSKMLYATSKQRFRPALDGVHYEIQATDPSELDIEVLRDRAH